MPNQQIFPSQSYPGAGDILTTPGSPDTVVTGIQTFPFSSTPPLANQVPVFISGQWVPSTTTLSNNDSISVAGVSVSDDYSIDVNRVDTEVQVNSAFAPNSFPISVAGVPAGV